MDEDITAPAVCSVHGGPLAEDHREINPDTGMQKDYKVLCPGERAKGFIRPYRDTYRHTTCGTITKMNSALAETYARDPYFYSGTFCASCKKHSPLSEFTWPDGSTVGS